MAREFLCYCCNKDISGSSYDVWTYVGFRPSKNYKFSATKMLYVTAAATNTIRSIKTLDIGNTHTITQMGELEYIY